MKKLSLVLGSLLIAATASAKEVVVAPVVVEEPVVAVVEECLVCEIPQFQPTGYFSYEAEYRGDSEHGGASKMRYANESRSHDGKPNAKYSGRANEKVEHELLGSVTLTPKDTFSFRARNRSSVINETDSRYTLNENKKDLRLRWDHAFGQIADTKATFSTRLEARMQDSHDSYTAYGKVEFKDYFSNNGFYKVNSFAMGPKVRYTDFDGIVNKNAANPADMDKNTEAYSMGYGADFNHLGAMDLGIAGTLETELNVLYLYSETNSREFGQQDVYGGANSRNTRNTTNTGRYTGNGNTFAVEAYLYHTLPLWSSDSNRYIVQFYQEGGLDPMVFDHRSSDNAGTIMYYEPKLQLVQHINTATSLTYSAGAYYANEWSNGKGEVGDFQWEPRAGVKLKTKF